MMLKCLHPVTLFFRTVKAGRSLTCPVMIGNMEEHINNVYSDVELARQRYERFCEKVVKKMLP